MSLAMNNLILLWVGYLGMVHFLDDQATDGGAVNQKYKIPDFLHRGADCKNLHRCKCP